MQFRRQSPAIVHSVKNARKSTNFVGDSNRLHLAKRKCLTWLWLAFSISRSLTNLA
jgi:hypothetical protein